MRNMKRSIAMLCPVCGNTRFETDEEGFEDLTDAPDEIELRCMDCGVVCTKQELIESNSELIDNTIQEMKEEAIKELRRAIGKWKI